MGYRGTLDEIKELNERNAINDPYLLNENSDDDDDNSDSCSSCTSSMMLDIIDD
jgi:hypothetical protein